MADMLTIGTQAANTYKRALDVTSHNVANVSTEGYTRQRAEISSNTPSVVGSTFLGGGSKVDGITRIHADYLQRQLVNSGSMLDKYDTQFSLAKQVEGVVASNDEGVQEFMQRFFDAMQTVSSNPTSSTSRQLLLDEAQNMQSHLGNLSSVLDDTNYQINAQLTGTTTEINDRLESVHNINLQVERAFATGTQVPNDLLDQRDQAILELGQYIDIKTFPQEDGRIDIHTAGGRLPLLSDNTLTRLEAGLGPYNDENRVELYMTVGGSRQIISDKIEGGQLGGILDFRTNMLDKAKNDLGVTMNGMIAGVNWQHYQGYDLNGDAGENFFTPLQIDALHSSENTGSEDGSNILVSFNPQAGVAEPPYTGAGPSAQPATFGDKQAYLSSAYNEIGQFKPIEYELRFNTTTDSFDFYNRDSGRRVTDTSGTAISVARGSGANVDGMYFDFTSVTTAPDNGDRFLVKPHQQVLSDFSVELNDPDMIAARGQSPVDSDSDGSLNDETPAAAAYGDNTNMANLASLQTRKLLFSDENNQPSETLLGGYSTMASNVGLYVRANDIKLTAQESVHQQLTDQRESMSGVSFDEEAANLIRFQQAYEASAQIISTSQSLFQTLLGAVRG